jgi:ParB-like chromosome segregation protein Spo0J
MTTIVLIENIPLAKIDFSPGNPRTDAADDLDGMAASMGVETDPMLVNPPVVRRINGGRYQLVAGERRVRAAALAGWMSIACQIKNLNAHAAHQLRVVENLHRRDLNPFDQAIALKISWLIANGDAMGLKAEIESILGKEQPQAHILADLEDLLQNAGFVSTHPAASWDEVLNRLGVEMTADSRKKLMRVLSVDAKVQEKVRDLGLTEAALRSIGTLEVREQKQLAKELTANPNLTRKVRRIARVVRAGTHTLDEALAEVKGQVASDEREPAYSEIIPDDEHMTDLVIRLLESATTAQQSLDGLREMLGDNYLEKMPEAWRGYADEALKIVRKM